ncbi:hypothetical protein VN97_g2900 [Penicillium thymicola]|uniref:Uncharacterized protein n=1 Tax=Penicillium thymicola TaxID=293382 RepID=A0AAI9TNA6_PENTH|nr:hypothetical protein VN97_g2900 [Penicillium thymicola]
MTQKAAPSPHPRTALNIPTSAYYHSRDLSHITNESALRFAWSFSIIGLVVEFVVAIDEARVRFTDDANLFLVFVESTDLITRCGEKKKNT